MSPSKPKYYVETSALYGEELLDSGRWLCYDTFSAEGNSLDELLDNCSGFTVDQDGGEGYEVSLWDLSGYPLARLTEAVIAEFRKQGGTP